MIQFLPFLFNFFLFFLTFSFADPINNILKVSVTKRDAITSVDKFHFSWTESLFQLIRYDTSVLLRTFQAPAKPASSKHIMLTEESKPSSIDHQKAIYSVLSDHSIPHGQGERVRSRTEDGRKRSKKRHDDLRSRDLVDLNVLFKLHKKTMIESLQDFSEIHQTMIQKMRSLEKSIILQSFFQLLWETNCKGLAKFVRLKADKTPRLDSAFMTRMKRKVQSLYLEKLGVKFDWADGAKPASVFTEDLGQRRVRKLMNATLIYMMGINMGSHEDDCCKVWRKYVKKEADAFPALQTKLQKLVEDEENEIINVFRSIYLTDFILQAGQRLGSQTSQGTLYMQYQKAHIFGIGMRRSDQIISQVLEAFYRAKNPFYAEMKRTCSLISWDWYDWDREFDHIYDLLDYRVASIIQKESVVSDPDKTLPSTPPPPPLDSDTLSTVLYDKDQLSKMSSVASSTMDRASVGSSAFMTSSEPSVASSKATIKDQGHDDGDDDDDEGDLEELSRLYITLDPDEIMKSLQESWQQKTDRGEEKKRENSLLNNPHLKSESSPLKTESPQLKREILPLKTENPQLKRESSPFKIESPQLKMKSSPLKTESSMLTKDSPQLKKVMSPLKTERSPLKNGENSQLKTPPLTPVRNHGEDEEDLEKVNTIKASYLTPPVTLARGEVELKRIDGGAVDVKGKGKMKIDDASQGEGNGAISNDAQFSERSAGKGRWIRPYKPLPRKPSKDILVSVVAQPQSFGKSTGRLISGQLNRKDRGEGEDRRQIYKLPSLNFDRSPVLSFEQ